MDRVNFLLYVIISTFAWQCFSSTYAYRGSVFQDDVFTKKLNACGFLNSKAIFIDGSDVEPALSAWMTKQEISMKYYDVRKGNNYKLQHWIRFVYVHDRIQEFVVIAKKPAIILETVDALFKNESYRGLAVLPHRSRWLLLIWTQRQLEDVQAQQVNSSLDNVAVAYLNLATNQQQNVIRVKQAWTFVWSTGKIRVSHVVNEDNLEKDCCDLFPNIKHGLNGRHLKVVAKANMDSYLRSEMDPVTGKMQYTGFLNKLIDSLSRMMNFTYAIWPPADRFGNLTWVDFSEYLAHGWADIGLTHFETWPKTNMTLMEPSSPFRYNVVTGVYRKPFNPWGSALSKMYNDVILYWILVVMYASSLLLTVTIYLLIVCVIKSPHTENHETSTTLVSGTTLHETSIFWERRAHQVVYTMACLMSSSLNQGSIPNVSQWSARALVWAWGLLNICLAAVYTSSITANVAVAKTPSLPFNTFSEMIARGDYSWGFIDNGSIAANLGRSKIDDNVHLFNNGEKIAKEQSIESTVEKYLQQPLPYKYVFIYVKDSLETWRRNQPNPEDYIVMNTTLFQTMHSLGFPSGSEMNDLISLNINRLYDTGVLQHMFQSQTNTSNPVQRADVGKVGVGVALYLSLGLGWTLAFFVFLPVSVLALVVEIAIGRIRRSRMECWCPRRSPVKVDDKS